MLQLPKPFAQLPMAHMDIEHSVLALAAAQTLPHMPQSFVFDEVSVSQPFTALPSQSL